MKLSNVFWPTLYANHQRQVIGEWRSRQDQLPFGHQPAVISVVERSRGSSSWTSRVRSNEERGIRIA